MPAIEHFAIYAADAPRLKNFYVEAFGMRVLVEGKGDPPGFFLGDANGGAIEIIGRPPGQSGANQRWVCHVAFWVDDYRAIRANLEKRGIVFETDTAVENDSVKTAFFLDPEGNRCQIVWRRDPLRS
jgi:glyoxylase I family protein